MRKKQQLPAGLHAGHAEFYAYKGKLRVMYQGKSCELRKLPGAILGSLYKQLDADTQANKELNAMGITSRHQRLEKYLSCRYGGFDQSPDMINGKLQAVDYTPCPLRGTCASEGKLCKPVQAISGHITPKELQVLTLAASGKLEKEIADALGIAKNTVNNHMASLYRKTNTQNKTELALFAFQKNIVLC